MQIQLERNYYWLYKALKAEEPIQIDTKTMSLSFEVEGDPYDCSLSVELLDLLKHFTIINAFPSLKA